jgi:hypothetical protein
MEIYQKRALDAPAEPSEPKASVPFDYATAAIVAQRIRQYLLTNSAPQVLSKKIVGLDAKTQLSNQQAVLGKTEEQLNKLITPELFVGHTLADVPELVSAIIPKTLELENVTPDVWKAVADAAANDKAVTTAATPPVAVASIAPPDDVVCSFSVMQWKETSDNFGRRVANQYIAIQVTVRNLNLQNEFLLHDIQIAVDTGLNRAQFGRFEAARDKLVVRNVAQRGQTEDRRNLIINTLQAVGAIAGGASTAVTNALSNTTEAQDMASAVAIFQGPFITGVTNIFPDHTIEHINHINDLTFSASATSKTIVPIQGSIPLVTFLSEKPLEQLPFSRCGTSPSKRFSDRSGDPWDPGASIYQFCTLDIYDQNGYPTNPVANANYTFQPSYYRKPYPFRNWKPAALDVFKRRIFVVVGGVHIKEVAKQPTLISISCAPSNDATLDLSKITGDNAICTLKGADLDLVDKVSLQNATDAADKTQVEGKSNVHGDTTQADVTFPKSELLKLKGATYKLYYSLTGGGPQSTSIVLTLKQVVSLDPSSADFGTVALKSTASKTITLTNNDNKALKITSIATTGSDKDFLYPAQTQAPNPCGSSVDIGKDCTITVTFTPTTAGAHGGTLTITDDAPSSPQTVELTGVGK